ncbi:aprataxin and PNK-like factor isoform X2 [Amia ocellicauda]|uniref:aprataxin and PNK-like factor isoform X2 n=1 Tax=Amia ocellicauda TaxID=2972642 RepID=UPI003463A1D3|nr:APLF factor [Amia calva]
MSQFELQPVDGGALIPLPQGETVIGRGPFLQVSDKRVSRNHGLLEVADGELRIKPTHLNPCFYQASLEDLPRPLEKDKWHPLHSGDLFSLLPGKFVYKVIATNQDCTQRNSQPLEEVSIAETPPVSPGTCEESGPQAGRDGLSDETLKVTQELSEAAEKKEESDKTELPASESIAIKALGSPTEASGCVKVAVDRKRVLPVWMLQGAAGGPSPATPAGNAKKGRKTNTGQPKNNGTPKQRSEVPYSKRSEGMETREASPGRKAKRKRSEDREDKSQTALSSPADDIRMVGEEELSAESDSVDWKLSGDEEVNIKRQKKNDANTRSSDLELSDSEAQEGPSQKPKPTGGQESQPAALSSARARAGRTQPRKPCLFGKECYRKNPVHFQEFSHPGDSDYVEPSSSSEEEVDDRPECPYGTDCYRKNPQHRKEYKHTKTPETEGRGSRRKCAQKGKKSAADGDDDDDGEPNDYNLNDSFIDDEEEEDFDHTDEDSDYMPESDGSATEDVTELKKEAKEFIKRRK